MTNAVYLAGPMEGVSQEAATGWRDKARTFLRSKSIYSLDPTRRAAFHSQKYDRNLSHRVVKMDLQDIANSTVVLANLTKEAVESGRAWGTISEIAHSHTKNKIIIVVMDEGFTHPFIDFYATEIHHNLEDALKAVCYYYG